MYGQGLRNTNHMWAFSAENRGWRQMPFWLQNVGVWWVEYGGYIPAVWEAKRWKQHYSTLEVHSKQAVRAKCVLRVDVGRSKILKGELVTTTSEKPFRTIFEEQLERDIPWVRLSICAINLHIMELLCSFLLLLSRWGEWLSLLLVGETNLLEWGREETALMQLGFCPRLPAEDFWSVVWPLGLLPSCLGWTKLGLGHSLRPSNCPAVFTDSSWENPNVTIQNIRTWVDCNNWLCVITGNPPANNGESETCVYWMLKDCSVNATSSVDRIPIDQYRRQDSWMFPIPPNLAGIWQLTAVLLHAPFVPSASTLMRRHSEGKPARPIFFLLFKCHLNKASRFNSQIIFSKVLHFLRISDKTTQTTFIDSASCSASA